MGLGPGGEEASSHYVREGADEGFLFPAELAAARPILNNASPIVGLRQERRPSLHNRAAALQHLRPLVGL